MRLFEQPAPEPDPNTMCESDRYSYWCEIDEKINAGEWVSEKTRAWHTQFRKSNTWEYFDNFYREFEECNNNFQR